MKSYYQQRAAEYDQVYEKPERQEDLRNIKATLPTHFTDQTVIEIACGTGYWTQFIAEQAKTIDGIDYEETVLSLAQHRCREMPHVNFQLNNLFKLETPPSAYDSLFGGFIFSHIKKEELDSFMSICLSQVNEGQIVFLDNKFMEGSSTPIHRVDTAGNSYQMRRLSKGQEFEVIKNFPTQAEMRELAAQHHLHVSWNEWDYFWMAIFTAHP